MATYTPPPKETLIAAKNRRGHTVYLERQFGVPVRMPRNSWGEQHPSRRDVYSFVWVENLVEIEGKQYVEVAYPDPPTNGGAAAGYMRRLRHLDELKAYDNICHYGIPVFDFGIDDGGSDRVKGYDDQSLLLLDNKTRLHDNGVRIAEIKAVIPINGAQGSRSDDDESSDAGANDTDSAEQAPRSQFAENQGRDSDDDVGSRHAGRSEQQDSEPDDEVEVTTPENLYMEGGTEEVRGKRRKRMAQVRKACFAYYRAQNNGVLECLECGYRTPPHSPRELIEAHHLLPLAQLESETATNPKTDVIPLCPNCHRLVNACEGVEAGAA